MTSKERYKYRLDNGLCGVCGCKLPENYEFVACEPCRVRAKAIRDKSKTKRKEKGLCCICGKPNDRGGWRCTECNNKKNEERRLEKALYIENGICPDCRKNEILGSEKICPECSARRYGYKIAQKKRRGDEFYETNRIAEKKIRERRAEEGKCTRCGRPKDDDNFHTCDKCRLKTRLKRREYLARHDTEKKSARETGGCYFCMNPVVPGMKTCETHRQMCETNAMASRESTRKIHNWYMYSSFGYRRAVGEAPMLTYKIVEVAPEGEKYNG